MKDKAILEWMEFVGWIPVLMVNAAIVFYCLWLVWYEIQAMPVPVYRASLFGLWHGILLLFIAPVMLSIHMGARAIERSTRRQALCEIRKSGCLRDPDQRRAKWLCRMVKANQITIAAVFGANAAPFMVCALLSI